MAWSLAAAVLLILCCSLDGVHGKGTRLLDIACPTSSSTLVHKYDHIQLSFGIHSYSGNAFNASQVLAQAYITAPGTPTPIVIDGFLYQNYTRSLDGSNQVLTPTGQQDFVVRFTPQSTGVYKYTLRFTDRGQQGTSSTCSFTAVSARSPGDDAGFVGVAANKQHFAFRDSGATYMGVGENVAWVSSKQTYDYDEYFGALAKAGANYARLWLTDSWVGTFIETKLGEYSMENSWNLDYIVALAERLGLRLMLTTESFNFLCHFKGGACFFPQFVYNQVNGGPISTPPEFFTNPMARAYYKQRLRYLVSRYAHSPNVLNWEFFNEVDITEGYNSTAQHQWNSEMAKYLKSIDHYGHMITTSMCCHKPDPAVYSIPELDHVAYHSYGTHDNKDMVNNNVYWPNAISQEFNKPAYLGEFGVSLPGGTTLPKADPDGTYLVHGIWAGVASVSACTSMTWWWDTWVAPQHLYHWYTGVSTYIATIDWAAYAWSNATLSVTSAGDGSGPVSGFGVSGSPLGTGAAPEYTMVQSMLLYNTACTWYDLIGGKQCPQSPAGTLVFTTSSTIDVAASATTVEAAFIDVATGEPFATATAQCDSATSGLRCTVAYPAFTSLMAIRVQHS